MKVKLYVEGAGQTDLQRRECRAAFSLFFGAAGLGGKRPRTVACGGRSRAYDAFKTAVRTQRPNELPLLLVDSEGPVAQGHSTWEHLKARPGDGWDKPKGAADDQAFLMVQVMETWFIADRDALQTFSGNRFRGNAIPSWPDLEVVPKENVYAALDRATAACKEKRYEKGKLSFELLATISPEKVEYASPHAKALLDRLKLL